MAGREAKTRAELAALIMERIREHPEWRDLVDVTVNSKTRHQPEHPNWDATFTIHGNAVPPEGAFAVVRELQRQFDST